ncbi:hypothetical protein ACLOJK_027325, partial [Asimina triloba]
LLLAQSRLLLPISPFRSPFSISSFRSPLPVYPFRSPPSDLPLPVSSLSRADLPLQHRRQQFRAPPAPSPPACSPPGRPRHLLPSL